MTLAQRDIDRLTPEAQWAWELLAGLREGHTMHDFATRLQTVANAVLDHVSISESGKVTGPTGTVTLTVTIGPNDVNSEAFVTATEKLAHKYPEDRSHVLYVGKGGSLHTRDPKTTRNPGLFSVDPVHGSNRVEFTTAATPDAAPAPLVANPGEDDDTGERLPYADN